MAIKRRAFAIRDEARRLRRHDLPAGSFGRGAFRFYAGPVSSGARKSNWVADALLLLGLAIVLRAPALGLSEIDWDESSFALVAREILHNRWPYTAVFDHKPVGLYIHFAAAIALFGDDPAAARLLGIAVTAAGAFLVRYLAIYRLGLSRAWGLLLGASYVFATVGFGGQAVYSEHLVNLYALASALLLSGRGRSRNLLAGAAAGVAVNVNYLAVPVVAGMLAGHCFGESRAKRSGWRDVARTVAAFVSGALIASVLLLLPIWLFSDLGGYFALQLKFLAGYPTARSYAGELADFIVEASAFLPLAAAAAALFHLQLRHVDARDRSSCPALFLGMTAGSLIAALASGYVFPHYMLLTVPGSLLLVASLASGAQRPVQQFSAAIVAATALMIAVPGLVVAALGARNLVADRGFGPGSGDVPRQLARIARDRVPPGSTIYAACAPLVLYQLLDARPPTPYPFYPFVMDPHYAAALGLDPDAEIARIFATHPSVVVLGDYGSCVGIPQSSWRKMRDALPRKGYAPFARYDSYWLFAPKPPARTAEIR